MAKQMIPIILIIVSLVASSSAQAKFSHEEGSWIFSITGEITSEDILQVRAALQAIKPETLPLSIRPLFELDSPGGNVYAAMEIGRLLRKARANCIVPVDWQCSSACVFVLAGAIERSIYGTVAIHRPYSTYVGQRNYQSAEKEYRTTETAARLYLKEMNLPDNLYEAMVKVSPEESWVLTRREIEDFSLSGVDPVEQEIRDSTLADRYGISKREYFSRKSQLASMCPTSPHKPSDQEIDERIACDEAFMYGIPLNLYKERKDQADKLCSPYKNDARKRWSCEQAVFRGEK